MDTVTESGQSVQDIMHLLFRWAHARDFGDWDELSRCFHDDAVIRIGWIAGSATDYVARSRDHAERKADGTIAKHIVSAPVIDVRGHRGTSISHATLHVRRAVGGVEADIESQMRFFDLLERRRGRWGIIKRTGVYEKDRLVAVDPKGFPSGFWDGIDLSRFPPAKRFLCFAQAKNGQKPNVDFISANSPAEQKLYVEGREWLSVVDDQQ